METITTKVKTKKNALWFRVGLEGKCLHNSMKNTLMEGKASSFLGTRSTERSTKKLCCITLIQARKDKSLNINQTQSRCPYQYVKILTSLLRQPEVPKRYACDDNWSNISNTSDSVSSDIQTPRRELKIRRAAEYFWRKSRCLDSRWNTDSSVWYIFSIETKTKEYTEK